MQLTTNPYPKDPHFTPNKSWQVLESAGNLWWVQLKAFPFVIINMAIIGALFILFRMHFVLDFHTLLWSFLIFIPLHELLHALTFPAPLSSSHIYVGFSFKNVVPFAAFTGIMTKQQAVWNLMAPFVIVTITGFLIIGVFGEQSLVKHIILFNAMAACVDSMDAWKIVRRLPKNARIKTSEDYTYWHSSSTI
jgi:hypothetical protein